jgi:hypothetical protein
MNHRKILYGTLVLVWSLAFTASCIEPYNPPAIKEIVDILVVDGFVNSTDSSAVVKLSRAIALSDTGEPAPELNAAVRIEDENGNFYPLVETGNGNYAIQKMNVNPSLKYRLAFTTSNSTQYASDFIELKISPPIDSITFRKDPRFERVGIYINTHDASNTTKYYQWTFNETWEYTSNHFSTVKLENGSIVPQDEDIYRCWKTQPSTEIYISSSNELREDVIRDFQLMAIPVGSTKLSRKFSLEVQQRALTKEAYDFWLQLKKTTESLGGLFDPLPAQVIGNLKNITNSSQPVLGYFSGGHVSKKRIFIKLSDLPIELRKITPPFCPVDSIENALLSTYPNMNLIGPYGEPFVEGYLYSGNSGCMDCTESGGIPVRPDFWE